jgi:hypothetical protein
MEAEPAPEPVILIIADISGYTRYMTANAKTLTHSQTIITELVKAIVSEVDLPLEVAKLEGDAVFLFGRKGSDPRAWLQKRELIGRKLLSFFHVFSEKVRHLSQSTTCSCHACTHIEKLRLKLIVHSGEALFHRVLNFQELAGVDVIIAHRLLKNSVQADQYLLLTESARADVILPDGTDLTEGIEHYDNLGQIGVAVYHPPGEPRRTMAEPARSMGIRFKDSWSLLTKLWLRPLPRGNSEFHNLNSDVSRLRQIGFAVFSLLLSPIFLPVGALFAFFKALRRQKR